MKKITFLTLLFLVGCKLDDSQIASSFLPKKMPDDLIISTYREYSDDKGENSQNLEIQLQVGNGFMKRYFLSDKSMSPEVKSFEVSYEDMENLYQKMRGLKVDMIKKTEGSSDNHDSGFFMFFDGNEISILDDETSDIDSPWKDNYDDALFAIDYFAVERIKE